MALAAALALAPGPARAQDAFSMPGPAEPKLSARDAASLVGSLADLMASGYVDSTLGERAAATLRANLRARRYRGLDRPRALVTRLAEDVQGVIHDGHFNILYFPPAAKGFKWVNEGEGEPDSTARLEEARQRLRAQNFGVLGARVLEGNLGYLDLARFDAPPELLRGPLASAFDLLANTDALIVDVRRNPGGDPASVQLAFSYFTDRPPFVASTRVTRGSGTREEFRTVADPGGAKYLGRPVFVLTGPATASGGEMFAYEMQHHGLATIVGGRTAGAAHSFDTMKIGDERIGNVMVLLPNARIVDARTGADWEGAGVTPDLACPVDDALAAATRAALDSVYARTDDPDARRALRDRLEALEWQASHAPPDSAQLAAYAGRYGNRRVFVEGGRLRYQRDQGPLVDLAPAGPDTFELLISMSPRPRVRFEMADGRARAMWLRTGANEERLARAP
jgi:hypothetical protein